MPGLTNIDSGESPYLPSYRTYSAEFLTVRIKASVSGRSTVDLVDTLDEKFQYNVPCAFSVGILLQDSTLAVKTMTTAAASLERALTELSILEKVNGPHRCGPLAKVWRLNVNN